MVNPSDLAAEVLRLRTEVERLTRERDEAQSLLRNLLAVAFGDGGERTAMFPTLAAAVEEAIRVVAEAKGERDEALCEIGRLTRERASARRSSPDLACGGPAEPTLLPDARCPACVLVEQGTMTGGARTEDGRLVCLEHAGPKVTEGHGEGAMTLGDKLNAALAARKAAEQAAGAPMFHGTPDRWYDAGRWRCPIGHVSTAILNVEAQRHQCLACGAPARLTFPEDTETDPPTVLE